MIFGMLNGYILSTLGIDKMYGYSIFFMGIVFDQFVGYIIYLSWVSN